MKKFIFLLILITVSLSSAAPTSSALTSSKEAVDMNDLVNFMDVDRTEKLTFTDSSLACQYFAQQAYASGLEVGMTRFYNRHGQSHYFNYIVIANRPVYIDPETDDILLFSSCTKYNPNHPLNRTQYFSTFPNITAPGYRDRTALLQPIKVKEIR